MRAMHFFCFFRNLALLWSVSVITYLKGKEISICFHQEKKKASVCFHTKNKIGQQLYLGVRWISVGVDAEMCAEHFCIHWWVSVNRGTGISIWNFNSHKRGRQFFFVIFVYNVRINIIQVLMLTILLNINVLWLYLFS